MLFCYHHLNLFESRDFNGEIKETSVFCFGKNLVYDNKLAVRCASIAKNVCSILFFWLIVPIYVRSANCSAHQSLCITLYVLAKTRICRVINEI